MCFMTFQGDPSNIKFPIIKSTLKFKDETHCEPKYENFILEHSVSQNIILSITLYMYKTMSYQQCLNHHEI